MWPTKATKELHEKQSALLDAAAAGNVAAVQAYLHDGVPITCTNESGSTSLHAAANYGHWDIVRLLLEKRVDVSAKDKNGSTPLHLAASKGHVAIVRSLLQKRAFIEAKTKDLETPLHYASKYNHVEVVRLLLAYGANLKVENNWHQTPLMLAHERGCVDVEDLLRKHPETLKLVAALRCKRIVSASKILEKDTINVNHRDRDKTPLLHLVLATQNFRLLETMLERPNLEVDATDATGMTALAIVLPTRSVEATYALLDLSAQLGAVDKTTVHAQMPLLAAVLRHATLNRNKGVVEALLDHGVNPATTNEQGETALHLAAASGHTAIVYTLLNHVQPLLRRSDQKDNTTVDVAVKGESCIDATNDAGESPLFVAAANGHVDAVKALVRASASAHHVTKDGSTLLHAAALGGKTNVLDQVLPLCSDVEACDERGHTPLHVAAAKGHASVVEYLVDAKANIFATTTTGDTPLTLATHPRVLAALKNAENEAKNELVDAVSTQQYDRVLTLLANGLSPNTTNKAGDSLLHLAVQGNDHAFLTALVRTPGLQMEIRNAAGVTPMTLAIQAGNRRLTSLLHAASHALKPEVSSDAYTMDVDAPLGVGGYGAVYKGTYNGRTVAIKTAVGPDGAATLLDETKTMLLCRSPYVLELLAVTKAPNPKLILEYMDAGDLRSYLDAKRLNQPTKVDVSSLEVAWVVANALADLHHDGLLHRDIKSPNVLLCSQNYIKLADLGIAREYESNMTMGIGTLRWMAPELLNPQQRYNSAADMYAFGVLLTELDSLAVPFANETSVPTIMRKLGDGALTPEFTPSCPTWLKDLATACVSFDPKMRPTAQEVIHDLRKQLVGQPSQPTTTAIMNMPETSLSILPSAPAAEMARAMPLREEVEPEDMPSSLVAQFSFNPRHLTTSSSWSSKGEPTPEPPHANASPMVSGNTEMNSLGVTSLVCQLCNTTNSLLDETCADCAESLPPAPFKLKILVRRLATHSVHHIATTIACFTCSDVSPMTRAACDCGEEFPPDAAKLHMLFKRIELAGSNSTP